MTHPLNVPVSLYIHMPWCERKCPYCDFNSHEGFTEELQAPYIKALLADLDSQADWLGRREIHSIFIGGGTPSLFSGESIDSLLSGIAQRARLSAGLEVTLETNPGSAEAARYRDYFQSGVTRLSVGVQSFDDDLLAQLGRVHSSAEAKQALDFADSAGFTRWNIDLMHGLPGQSAEGAAADLEAALLRSAGHISWYQLTLERNTAFWSNPPTLPDEDTLEAIQIAGEAKLHAAGFEQYEVSAYSLPGEQSRHNVNYWEFGDYLGIGAGAHGKVTLPDGTILRSRRTRAPADYLALSAKSEMPAPTSTPIPVASLPGEFAMNALRLRQGAPLSAFPERTGLSADRLMEAAAVAVSQGWVADPADGTFVATPMGYRFLDSVIASFL